MSYGSADQSKDGNNVLETQTRGNGPRDFVALKQA